MDIVSGSAPRRAPSSRPIAEARSQQSTVEVWEFEEGLIAGLAEAGQTGCHFFKRECAECHLVRSVRRFVSVFEGEAPWYGCCKKA